MKKLTTGLMLGLCTSTAFAATPTIEEMWIIIQQQQAEITQLKTQLVLTDEVLKENSVKVEATATMVEQVATGETSLASSWAERTQIGGYGEMHYNNLENNNDNGADIDEIDFHRFVLYLGHDFNDTTRMFSEVELEHSLTGKGEPGEVELEQAYIEHDLSSTTRMKAGLFLVPVGILNQTHEPTTFYGVERNNVEKNIIPTTWWEGGLALSGEILPGWSYEGAFTSGLNIDFAGGLYKIRDGRQKVAKADASKPAYTVNTKYTGIAGLELGATIQYQAGLGQGNYDEDVDAMLYSAHVAYRNGPFGLRALAAAWDIDDAINEVKAGANEQNGWYIEPSWLVMRNLGIFARYSEWDNLAGSDGETDISEWDVGVNYWLVENVVFKADYQWQDAPPGQKELEGFNLGVGFTY